MSTYSHELIADPDWEPYDVEPIANLPIPEGSTAIEDQDIELLRLLGRLELLTMEQIHALVYPHLSRQAAGTRLNRLRKRYDLLWRTYAGPIVTYQVHQPKRIVQQRIYIYGLSLEGKAALIDVNVESDDTTYARLRARDPRGKMPSPLSMSHDLQCSWFCTQILDVARRNRYVRGVYIQVEFHTVKAQRIDAYIILRIAPKHPRTMAEMGPIPLFDTELRRAGEIDIRIALEVDSGKESLPILLRKGETYGRLHDKGVYQDLYGGPVIPLLLVQRSHRAGLVAARWKATWTDNWAVVTTPQSMFTTGDVLWGDYRPLSDRSAFPLLSEVARGADGQVQITPMMDRATWDAGYVTVPVAAPSQQQLAIRKRWAKTPTPPTADSQE